MDSAIPQAHAAALNTKHASLQARIDAEEHRPHPDDATLAQLKKAKLKLKDVLLGH